MSKKHRGKVLADVAKRHHLTITEIAKMAGYTQSTFYKHKLQSNLDFDILYIYVISEKQSSYSGAGHKEIIRETFDFDKTCLAGDATRNRSRLGNPLVPPQQQFLQKLRL
ncbi:MAG: hypothetical protein EOO85_32635 [Pedobacter sp.]|nr:MAG: hypothetical protein EOO85_32635 [Pedobacter sp.]